jgi:hypothetical protein
VAAVVDAEEKVVPESAVPRPVLEKVKRKYPTASRKGFEQETENGAVAYEVKLVDGARRLEVVLAPDGKVLAEEEQIALETVPQKVRDALRTNAKYGTWKVAGVERIVTEERTDAPSYELKLTKGKSRVELVFSGDGQVTKTEVLKEKEKEERD